MKITIKSVTKDIFSLNLVQTSSVADLKKEICQLKEINDPSLLRLIYSGSVLENDELTLQDIGYEESEFMVILIRKKKVQKTQLVETPLSEDLPKNVLPIEETQYVTSTTPNNFDPTDEHIVKTNNSFTVHHPQLSSDQVQQLHHILETDPAVQEFLSQYPTMREHLQDPEVLIELLRRVGHPAANEMPDLHSENNPEDGVQVVHVTPEDAEALSDIRNMIKSIVGEVPLTEMQLNSLVYQGYGMMNKDKDATVRFLIDELMDNNII